MVTKLSGFVGHVTSGVVVVAPTRDNFFPTFLPPVVLGNLSPRRGVRIGDHGHHELLQLAILDVTFDLLLELEAFGGDVTVVFVETEVLVLVVMGASSWVGAR